MKHVAIPIFALNLSFILVSCSANGGYTYIVKGTEPSGELARSLVPPETEIISETDTGDTVPPETVSVTMTDTADIFSDTSDITSNKTDEAANKVITSNTEAHTQAASSAIDTSNTSAIKVISCTKSVKPGNNGSVKIRGTAGTEYSINVYYGSGPSRAKGLENKTAGKDGTVTWSWKVGTNTKPGKYEITVSGGGETLSLSFTVK